MKSPGVSYDIVRIKAQLPPLSEMLTKDGHTLRRAGTAMFMRCPLHEEKSPSCQVDDAAGRFHCFGCGAGGDIFDYYVKSHGYSFQDALAKLAGIAGIGPEVHDSASPRAITPRPAPAAAKTPDPLTGETLAEWHAACDTLANDEAQITRIAEWRGISAACIRWAASLGLMGTPTYWGTRREAFLVEMPTPAGLMPVSVHIRLAPGSRGNEESTKPSWRFAPSKCGSWPFLIGDPATADHIFLLEGQWDALALVSIMGWHERPHWPRVAVIGLRGSTSGAKLLQHQINPKAHLFAIADADGAGAGWFHSKGDTILVKGQEREVREDGLLAQLHPRVRQLTAFWPTTEKSDLNDLVKSGELDRATLISYLQPLMANAKLRPRPLTFNAWCKEHTAHPDPIGRAATFIRNDKTKPVGRRPLRSWETHWRNIQVPAELYADLCLLWAAYRAAT